MSTPQKKKKKGRRIHGVPDRWAQGCQVCDFYVALVSLWNKLTGGERLQVGFLGCFTKLFLHQRISWFKQKKKKKGELKTQTNFYKHMGYG